MGEQAIRVAIVEDNQKLRAEFVHLVSSAEGIEFVGDFESGEKALARLSQDAPDVVQPDVVLMDIQLPGMSGVECVRRLRSAAPKIQVVMLTVFEHSDWIFDALKSGASGYVLKRAPRREIIDAIRLVHEGGAPMSCSVARKVVQFFIQRPSSDELGRLTEREHTVLSKLSEGLSYDEIGGALAIRVNTVRKHIRAIYEKLEVSSRTEAVAKYFGR